MEFRLSKKKELKSIILGMVLLVLFSLILGCGQSVPEVVSENGHDNEALTIDNSQPASEATNAAVSNTAANTNRNTVDKVFTLTGKNFKFVMNGKDNPDLQVKVGDKVRIEFTSTEGFHDWKVDEFAATSRVKASESTSIEFVADKVGTLEYYCSVGSHRQLGMKGKLVVVVE